MFEKLIVTILLFSEDFGINYIVVYDDTNVYIAYGLGKLFKKEPCQQLQSLGNLTGITALNIDDNNHLYVATKSKELYFGDTNANFKPLTKLNKNINLIELDHQNQWCGAVHPRQYLDVRFKWCSY